MTTAVTLKVPRGLLRSEAALLSWQGGVQGVDVGVEWASSYIHIMLALHVSHLR